MKLNILILFMMSGCLVSSYNPNMPIEQLGVILKQNEEIILTHEEHGRLKIRNDGDSLRTIIYNGEERTLKLKKSKSVNGIYGEGMRFKNPSGGVIVYNYVEQTIFVHSEQEYQKYINYFRGLGFSPDLKEENLYTRFVTSVTGKRKNIWVALHMLKYVAKIPNERELKGSKL